LALLFHATLLKAAAVPLLEDDIPRKAEAALVLGGDAWATRIRKAGELVRAGYVPRAFVSGPQAYGGHESDFTIAYATTQGFPASYFQGVPNSCTATKMEAEYFGKFFQTKGVHSILLVTSNYHTHRAAALMRKQNPWLQVTVIPADDPAFTPDTWWKTREGRKLFLLEWSKTAAGSLGL
jgi:uncharacterized SAM-binding protein YcdF (DUF218 family)